MILFHQPALLRPSRMSLCLNYVSPDTELSLYYSTNDSTSRWNSKSGDGKGNSEHLMITSSSMWGVGRKFNRTDRLMNDFFSAPFWGRLVFTISNTFFLNYGSRQCRSGWAYQNLADEMFRENGKARDGA